MAYREEQEDLRAMNARSIVKNAEGNDDEPRAAIRAARKEGLRMVGRSKSARGGRKSGRR